MFALNLGWLVCWGEWTCEANQSCKWGRCACMGERRRDVRLSRQGVEARVVWVMGVLAKSELGREVLGPFRPWQLGLGLAFDHWALGPIKINNNDNNK